MSDREIVYVKEYEKQKTNLVEYRFVDENGEPTIEVLVNGSWEAACWLSSSGVMEIGFFSEEEREALPFNFDENGYIEVYR